jgi:hypothetical protein
MQMVEGPFNWQEKHLCREVLSNTNEKKPWSFMKWKRAMDTKLTTNYF